MKNYKRKSEFYLRNSNSLTKNSTTWINPQILYKFILLFAKNLLQILIFTLNTPTKHRTESWKEQTLWPRFKLTSRKSKKAHFITKKVISKRIMEWSIHTYREASRVSLCFDFVLILLWFPDGIASEKWKIWNFGLKPWELKIMTLLFYHSLVYRLSKAYLHLEHIFKQ